MPGLWTRSRSFWGRHHPILRKRLAGLPLLGELIPPRHWWAGVRWREEALVGLNGAWLVIPQAVTFAYLAGLPPEFGLYSAIFVTFFACLWGGSTMVGGPNTAVSILIGLSVAPLAGPGSPLYIQLVLLLSLMVGVLQLLAWLLRLGVFFQYLSPAAIVGIITGVGVQILLASLEGLLGMGGLPEFLPDKLWWLLVAAPGVAQWAGLGLGLLTVAAGMAVRRRYPRATLLVAIGVGWAAGVGYGAWVPQVESELPMVGRIPFSWDLLSAPPMGWEYWVLGLELLPQAALIALIGLAQSLVIAKQLTMEGEEGVDVHRETLAQGVANTLAPFFSSFAGSGSFNRTAVGRSLGARTPLAGMISSVLVLLLVWLLGGWLDTLPVAVMAGVLALVGWGMIKPEEIRRLLGMAEERGPFLATVATVVLLGLEPGILMAVAVSLVPFLLGASRVEFRRVQVGSGTSLEVYGNLFFASLEPFMAELRRLEGVDLILNLRHASYLDSGTAQLILRETRRRREQGRKCIVFAHTSRLETALNRVDTAGELEIVDSLPEARLALM